MKQSITSSYAQPNRNASRVRLVRAILAHQIGRALGRPLDLPFSLTLSPSIRCNSHCQTCDLWRKHENEMTIGEWERVLASLGQAPRWLTISGGEPFLYPELGRLVELCAHYCHPEVINIPSNAILTKRITTITEQIVQNSPHVRFVINLSLDGVGSRHDQLRGVPGNFQRFEDTYQALKDLARHYGNLSVGVHSVISAMNVDHLPALLRYIQELKPESYITEVAEERVELGTIGRPITPSPEQYAAAVELISQHLSARESHGLARVIQSFRLEYYELALQILAQRRQVIPCYAGWASAHIFTDGTVWACCVRGDSMGNLREANYDFAAVWYSDRAQAIRRSIRHRDCACPLANAAYTNILCNPVALARVAARYARTNRRHYRKALPCES